MSDDGSQVLFRVSGHGFFTAAMPPQGAVLPEWFLKLAEGLARRHLTPEGNLKDVSLEDFQAAAAAVPKKPAPGEETAVQWTNWLLDSATSRPLSPFEQQTFEEYLRSLKEQGSPAAARELLRYRPQDHEAAARAKLLVPALPK